MMGAQGAFPAQEIEVRRMTILLAASDWDDYLILLFIARLCALAGRNLGHNLLKRF
jgi:hypothetical protein